MNWVSIFVVANAADVTYTLINLNVINYDDCAFLNMAYKYFKDIHF